jgi:peptidylprolyl isomerase
MRRSLFTLLLAASTVLSIAQTAPKSATPGKPAVAGKTATAGAGTQLPPGVPPARGIVKTAFSLRYQDIKVGTGKDAEPNKIYKVHYTGWLAADGHKFDSSYDRRTPVIGADGKPELDESGKPKMGDPQPISVPQGFGRVIPGFDQGFTGMKVGGKRRLFIPWQLAYGARGRPGPDAAHPGIPPKADLIFDIELMDVTDLQLPANHPGMPGMGGMPGGHPAAAPPQGTPASPAASGSPTTPVTPAAPAPAAAPAAPASPATPPPTATAPAAPATPPPAEKPQQ